MKLFLSPCLITAPLTVSVTGEVLSVNGEDFDLSAIPDGATLPREAVTSDWLASDIERIDGELTLTLRLPISANAPQDARFPAPITVTEDGPIALPGASA